MRCAVEKFVLGEMAGYCVKKLRCVEAPGVRSSPAPSEHMLQVLSWSWLVGESLTQTTQVCIALVISCKHLYVWPQYGYISCGKYPGEYRVRSTRQASGLDI